MYSNPSFGGRQNIVDLLMLRSLVAVADCGAISVAAERIGISQPALSRRIRQLESHLQAELLARSQKGVELTAAGHLVVDEARSLINRYDSLRQRILSLQRIESATISIGGGATAVAFLLPTAIASFLHLYPGVRFQLKEAGSREVALDVAEGRLELGLITLPVAIRDIEINELMIDQIVLVAREDHPLVGKRRVQPADLSGENFVGFEAGSAIRQIIDSDLREAGITINVVMELRSVPAILRMVATTGNLAFVSRISLGDQSHIKAIPVQGLSLERKLAIVVRRHTPLSAAAAAFSERLQKRFGATPRAL